MDEKRKPPERKSSGEELGKKLLQSVREMQTSHRVRVTRIETNEVVEARRVMGMSQAQFARMLGISGRTLQEWEQGRRSPSGAARTLLRIASKHPELLREALE